MNDQELVDSVTKFVECKRALYEMAQTIDHELITRDPAIGFDVTIGRFANGLERCDDNALRSYIVLCNRAIVAGLARAKLTTPELSALGLHVVYPKGFPVATEEKKAPGFLNELKAKLGIK